MRSRVPLAFVVCVALEAPPLAAQEIETEAIPAEATPAEPEDDEALPRLDRIVVIGRRLEDRLFDVPGSADALCGAEIQRENASRTLPESLKEIPGVNVQKTGHGQGSPFIRGFTGFHTLVLIDGVRLNHAVMRSGPNQYWNTVDPLVIDSLEILKGPASVLYGSDAVGGTVNVITRSPELGGDGFYPGGRVHYRFASAEDSHTGRVEGHASYSDTFGALLGGSYKDFGELRAGTGSGELPNTGYEELDGDAKLIAFPRDDLELAVAFQRVDQDDAPRTHSTVHAVSFRGTDIGTDLRRDFDQDRHLAYTQATWRPEHDSWLSRAKLGLSWQLHEETEKRTRSNLRFRRQGFDDNVLGSFLQLDSPAPLSLGTLTYGVEYYHDDVDSFFRELNADGTLRSERPRGPVADDASYDLLGAYLQDAIELAEAFEVTAGGRFDFSHAEASEVDPDPALAPDFGPISEDFSAAVGSLRGVYHATDEWNLFAGASQGFRAPNLSDLTRFDVARSGEVEIPAPELDPEEFLSLEVGTKLRLDRFEAYASYHYTFIDGMIVRFPTGDTIDGDPVVTKDNVGDGFEHGVELGASWSFWEGFTAFASFGWLEGEADTFVGGEEKRQPLDKLPPAMAIVGLRWDSPARRWWVEGTVAIADGQDRLSAADKEDTQRIPPGGTPGYTVYTLRAGGRVREGLHVFVAIENITDKDYRVHGSGLNEPGTNAVIGLDWTFGGPPRESSGGRAGNG
jgi:hemoglobin/transferrin/lactoferrin receptor protein